MKHTLTWELHAADAPDTPLFHRLFSSSSSSSTSSSSSSTISLVVAQWVLDTRRKRVESFHSVFDDEYDCMFHPTAEEKEWTRRELFRRAQVLHKTHPRITDWSAFTERVCLSFNAGKTSPSPHPHTSWWQCLSHLKRELAPEEFDRFKRVRADVPLAQRVGEYCQELCSNRSE